MTVMTVEAGAEESRQPVARSQAGDTGAYAEIYRRNSGLVYSFIYKRVGYHHVAEDLTQETFARAIRDGATP